MALTTDTVSTEQRGTRVTVVAADHVAVAFASVRRSRLNRNWATVISRAGDRIGSTNRPLDAGLTAALHALAFPAEAA